MHTTTIESGTRPRPGPLRALLAVFGAAVVVVLLFVGFLALGWTRGAAALLLALPLAELYLRPRGRSAYVERHAGVDATSHTLVTVWSVGLAAVFAGGTAPGPVWVAAAIAGIGAVTAAVARLTWARFAPQLDARGLAGSDAAGAELRWFDRSSRRYVRIESAPLVLGIACQLLVGVLLVAEPASGVAVGVAGVFLATYALRSLAVGAVAFQRLRVGDRALRGTIGPDVASLAPEVLVHFSGSVHTIYQLDQWMPYILSSGLQTLLIVREQPTFDGVGGRWPVPVVFVGQFPDLDLVVPDSARLALYVNTGTKNNQLIRFDELTHVQLHHGDSDKPPSSGKTMRLYDHHIVAGEAAVDRLFEAGIVADRSQVSLVGRPVTDRLVEGPLGRGRPLVLYAPTWEGYHLDSALSSVGVMGEALVRQMPRDVVLVVRPHPLTGTADRRLKAVVRSIRRLCGARNADGLFVDPGSGPDLLELMNRADLLICDVSSVFVDFFVADRPVAVCDVSGVGADEIRSRYPSTTGAAIVAPDLANLREIVGDAFGEDVLQPQRHAARARLLATVGNAEQAFHAALQSLVDHAGRVVDS